MQIKLLHKWHLWLEKKLSFPGCTNKQLQGNITSFENHIFLSVVSLLLFVIPISIFAPQLTIYLNYQIAFSSLYALSTLLQLLFPRAYLITHTFVSSTMHLMTFYTMIELGGIATSGGLIFSGISNVIATVPRQKTWLPISMFIIFSVYVILLVILKPWLHVPDQMTPFYNSLLFGTTAIVLTGGALAFVLQFIRQQRKLEEIEARHLREMNEFKDRFFTNITHEFRTPLTIINGMADLISERPGEWMGTGLEKIKSNSGTLLRLVNQMLNLAKTEAGAGSVNFVRRDINKYLAYLTEQFSAEALRSKIDLRFTSRGGPLEIDFDPEKLMHIVTNLVSNALRYTPEGGRVEVIAGTVDDGNMFLIKIKDTGIGIAQEHLKHLFDRFYRAGQISPGSTGIGLALTKEMVQLLHGTISVESIEGKGSVFTVLLPVTRNAPLTDSQDVSIASPVKDDQYNRTRSTDEHPYPHKTSGKLLSDKTIIQANLPLLLIVEDNPDVVFYLQAIFKGEYRMEVAENGCTGLEKAKEIMPDIILSDVMMPVMDGIELLEKVKNDICTSHIPMVMLTAKADIESRLAGLERGADVYLAKPVDERELRIHLKNLVDLRKSLHERYRSFEKFTQTSDINIKKEDEFMMRVRQVLETNLKDEEFGISSLCSMLAVSHAQFYRKFKSLSNITIADYFKLLRLNKAKELLLTTRLNVTEVAYAAGFKSLAYFSREFDRTFGQSPSRLRKIQST
jgi:signal transduction histidine kinase/DNA-binding response OmpR family regulator